MRDADAELAASYRNGNPAALEALYWKHAERVWRYARHFTGSEDLAAEIAQETFFRVARSLGTYEGRALFTTWLFTVVRSVTIELAARARRAPAAMEAEDLERAAPAAPAAEEDLEREETRAAVRAALSRLPENEREAVLLCEIEDLPLRSAAEILGWGESRLKVTLFRARRRLKELLAAHVAAG